MVAPPKPRTHCANASRRRPFSDRRAGRLLSAIEFASCSPRGAHLDDRVGAVVLPSQAYPWRAQELALRHRYGPACGGAYWVAQSTRGRPLMWRARPERMKRWVYLVALPQPLLAR